MQNVLFLKYTKIKKKILLVFFTIGIFDPTIGE